ISRDIEIAQCFRCIPPVLHDVDGYDHYIFLRRKRKSPMINVKPAKCVLLVLIVTFSLLITVCQVSTGNAQAAGSSTIAIPPDGYAYYGVQLSWDVDTPAAY